MKYIAILTFNIGGKTVSFTGRQPFPVADAALRAALVAVTGVFQDNGDGTMTYIGDVQVQLADGTLVNVDAGGNLTLPQGAVLSTPLNSNAFI